MTREEAVAELKTRYLTMSQCLGKEELCKANEAIDLAIEALQTEQLKESQENFNKDSATESMLNADLISRQAAIDCVSYDEEYAIECIEALPSVQPKQKELTMEDVKDYCKQRNLVVVTKELFNKMNDTADKFYLYLQDRERR